MTLKTQDVKSFLGKSVVDSHQRPIGKIVSMYTNTRNEVSAVEIESGNGDFFNCPSNQLIIEGNAIVYMHDWETEAEELKTELELASKRVKALDELYRSGDIEKEIYEEMRKDNGSSIEKLEGMRQKLIEELTDRKIKLHDQIRELEASLANNKMQHASMEIGDEVYRSMCDSIRLGLKRTLSEKRFVEETEERLRILQTIQSAPVPTSTAIPIQTKNSTTPDGVVVVHMKESIF